MVRQLLTMGADVFPSYTQEDFEQEFSRFFVIHNAGEISGSEREKLNHDQHTANEKNAVY